MMNSKGRGKQLFQHPLFFVGFLFLVLLVIASLVHAVFFHGKIPVTTLLHNSHGEIVARGPFSPLEVPPLGTGPKGRQVFFMLIQGAKYTIGIAVVVAGMRVILSSFVGLIFGDFLTKINKYVTGIVNGFYYIPIALLCYVLLHDVIVVPHGAEEKYSFMAKVIFELVILTIVAIPTTSLLIGNQINQVYHQEFITSARTLGGNHFHILKRHVFPYMGPRLLIQFTQEIVQVLVLLIHLGIFHILFGGSLEEKFTEKTSVYVSLSSEWSGMVGKGFEHLDSWAWNFFDPVIAFMLIIMAFHFMIKGMEDVFEGKQRTGKNRRSLRKESPKQSQQALDFSFVHTYHK